MKIMTQKTRFFGTAYAETILMAIVLLMSSFALAVPANGHDADKVGSGTFADSVITVVKEGHSSKVLI